MGTFTVNTKINAPVEEVWQALGAIGDIHLWNPGVKASHLTSSSEAGLGATRYCDLGGRSYLEEEVVAWQPNKKLTMRIIDTNMPFVTADIRFALKPDGETTAVTLSPLYTLKFGPLGQLLDRIYVKNTYQKGMLALLAGLKKYVENNA